MAQMKGYTTGMFSWADLATTDLASARRFYGELFGWNYHDIPMGNGAVYAMARKGDADAAALSQMDAQMQKQMPPHWNAYIWVKDVDAMAKKAESLGGKVVAGPFDVFEAGRMAVVQDPTGAMVSLWQERQHKGAAIMNEPGAICWVELMTSDTKKAEAFYTQLLGWTAQTRDMGTLLYTTFSVGGKPTGGMMQAQPGTPPNWMVDFAVADCDASSKKAEQLGAKTHVPPSDIPGVGRFSVVQDPQGVWFSFIQLSREWLEK